MPLGPSVGKLNPWARWAFYLLMGLALLLLIWGAYKGWDELATYSFRLDWLSLGLSSLVYAPTIIVTVWGWHRILQGLGAQVSFRRNLKLYCSTNLARRLPTVLFYTAGRAYVYGRENVSPTIVSAAVLLELAMVASSGLLVTVILGLFFSELVLPGMVPLGAIALILVLVLAVAQSAFRGRILGKLPGRFRNISSLSIRRRDVIKWVVIYGVNWCLGGTTLFFLVRTFADVSWSDWPDIVSIWSLSGLVSTIVTILIPAGLGPREVTMAYLLKFVIPLPVSVAIAALSRVWIAANQLMWFFISLLM